MRPHEARKQADAAKLKFVLPESDHITLLNAYRAYKKSEFKRTCLIACSLICGLRQRGSRMVLAKLPQLSSAQIG